MCGWVGDGGVREVVWGSALNTGLQLSNSLSNTAEKHRSVIKQKQSTKKQKKKLKKIYYRIMTSNMNDTMHDIWTASSDNSISVISVYSHLYFH